MASANKVTLLDQLQDTATRIKQYILQQITDLAEAVQAALDALALGIPTKTSDLTNDSGFLTAHQDISGKLDKNQGSANAGKFLVVGSDGIIIMVTMTAWQGGSY